MEKIIRIDMCGLNVKVERSPEEYKLLGGRGLSAKVVNAEVPGTIHPLSGDNKLVVAPGLLAGTMAPSFGRISIGAKSPLTNTIKESNAGGTVAQKLDLLNIKAIVIEGKPRDKDAYIIFIDSAGAKIIAAPEFSGLMNYELIANLKKRYGEDIGVISIGPAGEEKMSASTIAVTDQDGRPSRHAARGGLGAVLGSKGIKAIVINAKGAGAVKIINREAFKEVLKDLIEIIKQDKGLQFTSKFGTPSVIKFTSKLGSMPSWNYHGGEVPGIENIFGDAISKINSSRGGKMQGCMPGCVVQCSIVFNGSDERHLTSALEYETLAMFGSNLGIVDLDAIARMDRLCDDLGLDTIETGSAIAQLMEAGIIRFGDQEKVINVLEDLKQRDYIGRIVGQGCAFTAHYLGLDRVPVSKGQAFPAHDPRACKAVGVTYSTSPMGADHTAGIDYDNSLSAEGKVARSLDMQILSAVIDSVGYCMLALPANASLMYDIMARLINARYGTKLSRADILAIGKSTIEEELSFNHSAGWTATHNRLPDFMRTEKLPPHNVVFDVPQNEIDSIFN